MPLDAHQLARLRVARETGHLPADLAAWVLERLGQLEALEQSHAERLAARNAALLAAAEDIDDPPTAARRLAQRFDLSERQARRILYGR